MTTLPPEKPPVTKEQYDVALAALLFHQSKVDYYIQITRQYLYQIEKKKV